MTPNSEHLATILKAMGPVTVAVSGGVDSMTLACFAHRHMGSQNVMMVHAASPAVPQDAGERITQLAQTEGWRLSIVDAGEFADPAYRANPVNRCFFCKSNLYGTLSALSDGIVLSGTNTDDLGDYRPGLEAARNHDVRHPYVEADIDKDEVRALARALGLPEFAELPSSPCLSSRVETGLPIQADQLALIDAVETWCREQLAPQTVRCRIRRLGFVIELDAKTHDRLAGQHRRNVVDKLCRVLPELTQHNIAITTYQRGSAFVGDRTINAGHPQ